MNKQENEFDERLDLLVSDVAQLKENLRKSVSIQNSKQAQNQAEEDKLYITQDYLE